MYFEDLGFVAHTERVYNESGQIKCCISIRCPFTLECSANSNFPGLLRTHAEHGCVFFYGERGIRNCQTLWQQLISCRKKRIRHVKSFFPPTSAVRGELGHPHTKLVGSADIRMSTFTSLQQLQLYRLPKPCIQRGGE